MFKNKYKFLKKEKIEIMIIELSLCSDLQLLNHNRRSCLRLHSCRELCLNNPYV